MGYISYLNDKAKCPLFRRVVKSGQNWKIAGVQCDFIADGSGFSASKVIIRTDGLRGLKELKKRYCDDIHGYHDCPCYQAWLKAQEKRIG